MNWELKGKSARMWIAGYVTKEDKKNVYNRYRNLFSSFDFPELNWTDFTLLSELLASRNTLYKSFNIFLGEIMECFHSEVATYRNKAVKAIRHIAADVPEILDEVIYIFILILISLPLFNTTHNY